MSDDPQIPDLDDIEEIEEIEPIPVEEASDALDSAVTSISESVSYGGDASGRTGGTGHSGQAGSQSSVSSASGPSASAGQPAPSDGAGGDDPLLGIRLKGTYEITKKVGEGGMGNVYAAVQHPLGRDVAVKILKPTDTNPEGEHYFMREVQAINMLRHPNIINIVDFGKDDGLLYLVMEYLPGQTLKRIIRKEFPLDPVRVCDIAIQVLSGLEQAHRTDIVHCDLKPANIMVERVAGQNDFVKVLDFGIAKVKAPSVEVGPYTQAGNIVGTFDYMSPEQIMRKDLDGRADVWSLGVILYEMLTRKRIFHDKDAVSIIGRVMQMPIQPPSSVHKGIPSVLNDIVMQAMERNINKRFASAAHMRQALQEAKEILKAGGAGSYGRGGGGDSTGSYTGSHSGSLAASGLVRDESGSLTGSGPISRSGMTGRRQIGDEHSHTSRSGTSSLSTRSGDFGVEHSSRLATGIAQGTSILDQTFSAEELKGSLLGERRKVAVLAIKQRARRAEGIDAEEVARRSRREAEIVKEVVDHYDGEIDSFLGGTFTILFGATKARVGDNLRAIECAAEIQRRFRELPQGAEHLGLGLVYGEVFITKSKDGNAYGDAIDRAITVATKAKNATVYADESLSDVTSQQVNYDAPRKVGGGEVAEVLKVNKTAKALEAEDAEFEELEIYVPRPELFDQLSRQAADVKAGHGGGVAILGETGVGKSVLIEKFVAEKAAGEWEAFLASDDAAGQTLAPVRAWIRQIAETYKDPARLVKKACQSLGMNQDVEAVVAFFLDEKGQDVEPKRLPWSSQQAYAHFTAALLHRLIRFAMKKGPVLLAIDDVRVEDASLVEFLDGLLARIQKLPVFVVVTRRGEASIRDHGLPASFEIMAIGGLSQPQSKQFIAQLFGHTPPMEVVGQLHGRTSGNPMFLRELVRALRRTYGPEGLTAENLAEGDIPLNLHELLAQRVDELGDQLRDLLRLASVLGESFREGWFFQITPSHLEPRANLEELVARGLFSARFDSLGRVNLSFNPRALRQIVYDRLPDETRIAIHSRVIEFLEQAADVAAVEPLEVPMMLAFHYRSVGSLEGAAHYLTEAATLLLDLYDYAGAISHYQDALDLLDQAEIGKREVRRLHTQIKLLTALRESGRVEDAQQIIEDLPPVDALPAEVHFDLLYEIGLTGLEAGSIEASHTALLRLAEESAAAGDAKMEVKALLALAQIFEKQNALAQAAELLGDVSSKVEMLGDIDLTDPDDRKLYWTAYNQLGTLFIRQRDFQRAQQFLNPALQRAREIQDHRGMVRVLSNLGALCLSIRDVGRARDYFGNALAAARGIGDLLNQARILTNLGIAAIEANDLEAAKKQFKEARSIAEDIGWYEGLAELSIHIKRLKKALG